MEQKIIGQVTTKPMEINDGKGNHLYTIPGQTYNVVGISELNGNLCYITDTIYKEHGPWKEPLVIAGFLAARYIPYPEVMDE